MNYKKIKAERFQEKKPKVDGWTVAITVASIFPFLQAISLLIVIL